MSPTSHPTPVLGEDWPCVRVQLPHTPSTFEPERTPSILGPRPSFSRAPSEYLGGPPRLSGTPETIPLSILEPSPTIAEVPEGPEVPSVSEGPEPGRDTAPSTSLSAPAKIPLVRAQRPNHITLPAPYVHVPAHPIPTPAPSSKRNSRVFPSTPSVEKGDKIGDGLSVLVVDDDLLTRRLMSRMLQVCLFILLALAVRSSLFLATGMSDRNSREWTYRSYTAHHRRKSISGISPSDTSSDAKARDSSGW